jgi:hypothetical protein
MSRQLFLGILFAVVACGGTTEPIKQQPKLDPVITIRLRDQLDTTTAPGRAQWHTYVLLSGPYNDQNGISNQGTITLDDVRRGFGVHCITVGADSVGQRLVAVLAVADTTTSAGSPDASGDAIAAAWYNGNHNLPSGWMALFTAPMDAWDSQQFAAGHGLNSSDPIKWGWDWTASGTTSFYERDVADIDRCTHG